MDRIVGCGLCGGDGVDVVSDGVEVGGFLVVVKLVIEVVVVVGGGVVELECGVGGGVGGGNGL